MDVEKLKHGGNKMKVTGMLPEVLLNKKLGIGEVSKYLGINISTLRYWEKEFHQFLRTSRTKGGQRRYTEENIKILQEIKYLLEVEKYTIDGVKRRMQLNRRNRKDFKTLLSEALEDIEKGGNKKEVIENIVMRHQLNV